MRLHSLTQCPHRIASSEQMAALMLTDEDNEFPPSHTLPESERLVQATGGRVAMVLAFEKSTLRQRQSFRFEQL
jgi:hypothetical protein